MTKQFLAATLLSGSLLTVLSQPSRADLRLTVERRVASGQPESGPNDSTALAPVVSSRTFYFKGNRVREEGPDGAVTLYDRSSNKVYTLNAGDRTYRVASLKDVLDQPEDSPVEQSARRPAFGSVSADVGIRAAEKDAIDAVRQIAGREAKRFDVTVTLRRESQGGGFQRGGGGGGYPGGGFPGGRRGGRFPGGGGRRSPGGGGSESDRRGTGMGQIEGEMFVADNADTSIKVKEPFLPVCALAADIPARSALAHKLAGVKGIPLYIQLERKATAGPASDSAMRTITVEVKSVSTDTLQDSLFALPESYRQADSTPR